MENSAEKTKNNTTLIIIIVGIFLVLACACVLCLASIAVPAMLKAKDSSQDVSKLKELEKVRNALSDFYVKYNAEPSICLENDIKTMKVVEQGKLCDSDPKVVMIWNSTYNFIQREKCADSDNRNNIIFVHDPKRNAVVLCDGESEVETLVYK